MNTHRSEIAIILDRSGSMNLIREATIEGFNAFLHSQQQAPGLVRLTLVQFDHEQLVTHDALPVAEILPLDADTFVPRGSTALLDAIGDTIDRLARRFEAMSDDQRPADVTVAILTDGQENSSRRFTWHQVSDRIQRQTTDHHWDFLYLGADADTIATASRLQIEPAHTASFRMQKAGVESLYSSMSRKVTARRSMRQGTASAMEASDSAASMTDLIREEERKRAGGDSPETDSGRPKDDRDPGDTPS